MKKRVELEQVVIRQHLSFAQMITSSTFFSTVRVTVTCSPSISSSKSSTRSSVSSLNDTSSCQWQYHDDHWNDYDTPTCRQIESAFLAGDDQVTLTEGSYAQGKELHRVYTVMFSSGFQKNNRTDMCRPIRRLPASSRFLDVLETEHKVGLDSVVVEVKLSDMPNSGDSECITCLCGFDSQTPPHKLVNCAGRDLHYFHKECIMRWLSVKPQCPFCKTIYRTITGNQPNGNMQVQHITRQLPDYTGKNSNGTWVVHWDMPSGIQDASHPNPGVPFSGTSRVAYLPDCEQGTRVLKMLQIAFKRRLMFTVGTSLTNGTPNTVIWNGIHCRTEFNNSSGYGYPAPTYLDHVTEELKIKGVMLQ